MPIPVLGCHSFAMRGVSRAAPPRSRWHSSTPTRLPVPCHDPWIFFVPQADYLGAAWRWGPSQDNVGLVRLLLLRFLFPETRAGSAQFLARFGGASHLTAPQIEAVVSLCCPGEDPVRAMAERTRPVCGTGERARVAGDGCWCM